MALFNPSRGLNSTLGGAINLLPGASMKLPVNYNELHFSERKLVREEYVKRQNGLCSHCGEPLEGDPASEITKLRVNRKLFPKTFFKWHVHLHHSHKTGMTIGAVHNYCNAVLWQYHGE
jgi:hypothetical protein